MTQSPSISASYGASARLTCTLNSDFSVGSYYIYWCQQKTGSPPHYLLWYHSDSSSLSQPVLTQPPSLSASPGASVRLTCTLSNGFSVGVHRIDWHQQKPGSPPHYLLNYHTDSDKHQGSGVPSRFSGSKDSSANTGVLHISGLQPEDEADYFCGTWNNYVYHSDTDTWGSGAKSSGNTGAGLCFSAC
ncbi:Immunoglobulin omega chain [Tupaia chinensis]|nr:Immunoglobulin omega chain [Tupaia chinensis]